MDKMSENSFEETVIMSKNNLEETDKNAKYNLEEMPGSCYNKDIFGR